MRPGHLMSISALFMSRTATASRTTVGTIISEVGLTLAPDVEHVVYA
jgi:hypothetical protein